jgi:hypothetical protein
MNQVPFPAKSEGDTAPKIDEDRDPKAAMAPKLRAGKPEPRPSALDLMFAYYDPKDG